MLSVLRCMIYAAAAGVAASSSIGSVLVVGSVNADIIIPIESMPLKGETIVARNTVDSGRTLAGGKGANQAVACRRLGCDSFFAGRWGIDSNAELLKSTLVNEHVDISLCTQSDRPSGMGLVFLEKDGTVSCIVVGGSNAAWPDPIDPLTLIPSSSSTTKVSCIMLQMEIPQHINEAIAVLANERGIPIFQDIGGEDRSISTNHLSMCSYISPNLSELRRLTGLAIIDDHDVLAACRHLQSMGARNVLVTLGSEGSLLLTEEGQIYRQECIPADEVIDETGAGDNFRAAFVVAHFVEKLGLKDSLEYAAAAGSICVQRIGAIPSCGSREEVQARLRRHRGGGALYVRGGSQAGADNDDCPYLFASRLNSMGARLDLWDGAADVGGLVARQGLVRGLDLVDFNYPQHIEGALNDKELQRLRGALARGGLRCGAVCLRYPRRFQLGALTHPDPAMRREAVLLTKEACEWSLALGGGEVVIWSAFDGFDYSLQCDHDEMWRRVVDAVREVCDAFPTVKVSLEFKPTDENTRFFSVPSTGAAVLLAHEVDRENFGLTIDFGHCLMAGENAAQSVAMVQRACPGKLFGVQLGDGYGRLGAEDGLAFGSVHSRSALEFVLWLVKTGFDGHIYFDTFPRNEDPIKEAEYNIRVFKKMYRIAKELLRDGALKQCWSTQDAMGVLENLEKNFL